MTMANLYPPDITELDQKYQKEPTVLNELNLERAKLEYYRAQHERNPGDKDLARRISFHESEVVRLEGELKIA